MNNEESIEKPLLIGPWGGSGGYYWDDGVHSTIRKVTVSHSDCINSISIEYDQNGSSISSKLHGSGYGQKLDSVNLDYPEEYLTSVHGYYGSWTEWGVVMVKSLTFFSNRKTFGPYGVEQGTYFSFPGTGRKIVGFHGRSGWLLDAIGIYFEPLERKVPSKSIHALESSNTLNPEKDWLKYSVIQGRDGEGYDIIVAVRERDSFGNSNPNTVTSTKQNQIPESPKYHHVSPRLKNVDASPKTKSSVASYGPWGGTGGSVFDDGSYTGIRQINLSYDDAIRSIKVCYDQEGKVVWGTTRGDSGGDRFNKVIFDYPAERLKRITGTYGPLVYGGRAVVRSISFHTNRRKYGPFGVEKESSFTSNVNIKKSERIVGFYGRESLSLEVIGVRVREAETTGNSDSSDEEPEEIKKESSHSNPISEFYYRKSFKITNFWGYH